MSGVPIGHMSVLPIGIKHERRANWAHERPACAPVPVPVRLCLCACACAPVPLRLFLYACACAPFDLPANWHRTYLPFAISFFLCNCLTNSLFFLCEGGVIDLHGVLQWFDNQGPHHLFTLCVRVCACCVCACVRVRCVRIFRPAGT